MKKLFLSVTMLLTATAMCLGQWAQVAGGIRTDTFVGIGVNPFSKLTLHNGSLLIFGDPTGNSEVTLSGPGHRFYYDHFRHALRGGEVTGSQWNPGNVGPYSLAFGYNTQASQYSVAIGKNSGALAHASVALGEENLADYPNSLALGSYASAEAHNAIAIGHLVTAGGYNSVVIGRGLTTEYLALPLTNNISNSLMVGFKTLVPALFVGPSAVGYNFGKVGIGTTNPQSEFSVNGKITAKELELTMVGWPDYVFSDNYNLRSLEETERFIQEHKHLPGVPSEQEILEKGINVGEMNKIMMEKIEELTLYVIELKKENDRLKMALDQPKGK